MEEIKDIIQTVIGNISERRHQEERDLQAAWDGLLKDKEKAHVRIAAFQKEVLYVNADSPAWLFQMNLKKQSLLRGLQHHVPGVKKIYLKIGKVT